MTATPSIRAINLYPWVDTEEPAMPVLTTEIGNRGTTCIIGDNSQRLAFYLRALGGVDDIRDGELYLFGEPFVGMTHHAWRQTRLKLGFVTRTAPLLSVLNGLENVVLPALYHKRMPREEAEASAHILLAALRCDADLTLLPAYLTALERTQLALARAAILEPAVLLLEEPYHELDIDEHDNINGFLEYWAKSHALVISTRNLHFVKQQANSIIFAGEEKILYFKSWQEFSDCPDTAVTAYLQQYRNSYYL